MKKIVIAISLIVLVFMLIAPATSHAWGRGGYYGHRGGYGWGIAGAAVGGLLLGSMIGNALAPPVYYAPPPPAYYAPPPPRAYYYYPSPAPRAYVYP